MKDQLSGAQTRWDRRRERTHGRLLHAAEHLFRTHGFDSTTVEEIAAAADVAKGTFFNYFSSKESLLGELLYLRIRPLLEIPPPAGAATDRIWALLDGVRKELSPYTHLWQRMAMYVLANPLPELLPEGHVSLADALSRLVREGQGEGAFSPALDADAAGALIATYFFRLSVLECLGTSQSAILWEDRMQVALEILYRGLCVATRDPLCPDSASPGR
ncbi:MAG: TetR/AcrR family transcriptional regulator [Anaerolineae bacterium]|nr:TetR/AcrR family transcriptional regulator [Anaerolineae bacterium]